MNYAERWKKAKETFKTDAKGAKPDVNQDKHKTGIATALKGVDAIVKEGDSDHKRKGLKDPDAWFASLNRAAGVYDEKRVDYIAILKKEASNQARPDEFKNAVPRLLKELEEIEKSITSFIKVATVEYGAVLKNADIYRKSIGKLREFTGKAQAQAANVSPKLREIYKQWFALALSASETHPDMPLLEKSAEDTYGKSIAEAVEALLKILSERQFPEAFDRSDQTEFSTQLKSMQHVGFSIKETEGQLSRYVTLLGQIKKWTEVGVHNWGVKV